MIIIGGIILYNESNKSGESSSEESTSKQPSGLKDAEKIISGGRAPDRTTSTGNKIYETPPTGQTADEVMGGIRGLEGASTEVKEGERGPVEVVTLPDGSKVVDRNSKSGPRTIETQRTTKNGKSKISSETRFPDDPLKR